MTSDAHFPDVKPFPGDDAAEQIRAHDPKDNRPPLEEQVTMDFEEQLRDGGLLERISTITESAGKAPEITDKTIAGKVGDLIAMARECRKRIEERRETHNRPLLNAQRALKGRADALLSPMDEAINALKRRLDAFMAEEARKAADKQRQADEEARRLREEQAQREREAAEAGAPPPPPAPIIEAPRIEQPVARGDIGRVGTKTVWRHEIEVPIKQLPKAILENAAVREAVDKVIAGAIRAGNREIKGVRIWSEQVSNVR